MTFARRSLQRRPELSITICRVPYSTWEIFAPYHYMSAELSKVARCFGLFVGDRIAAFCAVLHRPISRDKNAIHIFGISRVVTLPDWQGLGLAPLLDDTLGSAFKSLGYRFRNYPAHPAFVRVHMASKNWRMIGKPGRFKHTHGTYGRSMGGRPNATFEYVGPAMTDRNTAKQLIS